MLTALLVLTGCGTGTPGPTTGAGPTGRPGATGFLELETLRAKLRFFLGDRCASGDPATVYPRCARFTTEVRTVLPQVRRDVPAAADQADATGRALDQLARTGCEPAPGTTGGGDPAVCGSAYRQVQDGLRGLVVAVG